MRKGSIYKPFKLTWSDEKVTYRYALSVESIKHELMEEDLRKDHDYTAVCIDIEEVKWEDVPKIWKLKHYIWL